MISSASNFQNELAKASNSRIPVIDKDVKTVVDGPAKNNLLKKLFDSTVEKGKI